MAEFNEPPASNVYFAPFVALEKYLDATKSNAKPMRVRGVAVNRDPPLLD